MNFTKYLDGKYSDITCKIIQNETVNELKLHMILLNNHFEYFSYMEHFNSNINKDNHSFVCNHSYKVAKLFFESVYYDKYIDYIVDNIKSWNDEDIIEFILMFQEYIHISADNIIHTFIIKNIAPKNTQFLLYLNPILYNDEYVSFMLDKMVQDKDHLIFSHLIKAFIQNNREIYLFRLIHKITSNNCINMFEDLQHLIIKHSLNQLFDFNRIRALQIYKIPALYIYFIEECVLINNSTIALNKYEIETLLQNYKIIKCNVIIMLYRIKCDMNLTLELVENNLEIWINNTYELTDPDIITYALFPLIQINKKYDSVRYDMYKIHINSNESINSDESNNSNQNVRIIKELSINSDESNNSNQNVQIIKELSDNLMSDLSFTSEDTTRFNNTDSNYINIINVLHNKLLNMNKDKLSEYMNEFTAAILNMILSKMNKIIYNKNCNKKISDILKWTTNILHQHVFIESLRNCDILQSNFSKLHNWYEIIVDMFKLNEFITDRISLEIIATIYIKSDQTEESFRHIIKYIIDKRGFLNYTHYSLKWISERLNIPFKCDINNIISITADSIREYEYNILKKDFIEK